MNVAVQGLGEMMRTTCGDGSTAVPNTTACAAGACSSVEAVKAATTVLRSVENVVAGDFMQLLYAGLGRENYVLCTGRLPLPVTSPEGEPEY